LLAILLSVALTGLLAAAPEDKKGVRLFYRMLGAPSNGPFPRKTRTVAAPDGAPRTASTGMANAGFTEYPFCSGPWSFTFRESYGMFPRFADSVPIDPARVNTCDLLMDFVYEPDTCVWGPACAEFGQSFVADGRELVSVTHLVASPLARILISLHENGPDGKQIGPTKSFTSGHSLEWGLARWAPAEAPLQIGKPYYLRLRRDDDKPWNPYFPAAGDVYPLGQAFFDGRPRPESDLGLWIVTEPYQVSRARVLDADAEGWVRQTTGVEFIPRTPNLRLITVDLAPVPTFCVNLVACVWDGPARNHLLAGPKYNASCARADSFYTGSFLFTPDELPVTPDRTYVVEIFTVPFKEHHTPQIPDDRSALPPRDLRVRLYGRTHQQPLPVIYNLSTAFPDPRTLTLSWQLSRPAAVQIEFKNTLKNRSVKKIVSGVNHVTFTDLEPGADYDFRLSAAPPGQPSPFKSKRLWRTPLYRVRTPGGKPAPRLWPETPEFFVPLAPRPASPTSTPDPTELVFRSKLIFREDFEKPLAGWSESPAGRAARSGPDTPLTPPSGQHMFGWTHRAPDQKRDVLLQNIIHRRIKTTPFRRYLIVLDAVTYVPAGPRGDARVRLAADPQGADNFSGKNSSQWFWSDGKWLTLRHGFRAETDRASLAVGFFRWRDLDRSSAYIDNFRVYELPDDS